MTAKDTLFLTNLTFKSVVKDKLFYNRYEYAISFHLDEVSCLRELDHGYIDLIIERRKHWREMTRQRWGSPAARIILTKRHRDITEDTVKNLHDLADVLLNAGVDFKLVTSVESAWVYTNDLGLLAELNANPVLKWKKLSQAVINRPKNTIKLKTSKYRYRSYFKLTKLTQHEKTTLANFFKNQQDYVRLSPSLIAWLDNPFLRLQDYFFIDYVEESWLVMLGLVRPGIVRKTAEIIAG